MMRRIPPSPERHRLPLRGLIVLGALVALAAALFFALSARDKGGRDAPKAPAHVGGSTYKSRAVARHGDPRDGRAGQDKLVISGNVYSMTTGEPLPGASIVATTFQI